MKAFFIAWKDTLTRFRDWKAVIGFIMAPLVISMVIGAAFGDQFRGEAAIKDIKVILVNNDAGEFGQLYFDIFTSDELEDLFDVSVLDDYDEAFDLVAAGGTRGVVFIPAGFSEDLMAAAENSGQEVEAITVQVITDPAASISPYIISSVVDQISAEINQSLLSGKVGANQALGYADLLGPSLANLAQVVPEVIESRAGDNSRSLVMLETIEVGEAEDDINPFAFFGPSMAIFFLMFSMMDGTRSILQEDTRGTLPRLISTPTRVGQIVLGKLGGSFLTGILQFLVLVIASSLLFDFRWGSSVWGLLLLVVATVSAATSLGALIASFAKNETQATIIGSAVVMLFGALGGTFSPADTLPGLLQVLSKMTIVRWAMDGFTKLTILGSDLAGITLEAGVLFGIAVVTFSLAVVLFQRRFVR